MDLPSIVILQRSYHSNNTEGTIYLPSGKVLRAIELPWLNNTPNVSCYPEGVYLAKWLNRSNSGKYKRVWHIQNVPSRSGILWHVGNYIKDTLGCTLPGLRYGTLNNEPAVLSSGAAMNIIRRELGRKDFILVVIKCG